MFKNISFLLSKQLVTRTIAMPRDTNYMGNIFGGWILSQMDLGGAVLCRNITTHKMVTIGIKDVRFIKPGHARYGEI